VYNYLKMSVYLRELNNDMLKLNQRLRITNFIPEGLIQLIEKNVPDNNFILGVKYETGECQICISGHQKENENIDEGCQRELLEELFLKPKNIVKQNFKINNNTFYNLAIREAYISKSYIENKGNDLKQRAVVCVHGNEFEILRYLCKIKTQDKNNDFISGIWAAKKNKILAIMKKIKSQCGRYYIY